MGSGAFGRSWNLNSSENKGWDEGKALRRSLSEGTGRALAPSGWNKPILTQLLALCPFDTMPGVFLHGAAAGLDHVRAQHGAINGF